MSKSVFRKMAELPFVRRITHSLGRRPQQHVRENHASSTVRTWAASFGHRLRSILPWRRTAVSLAIAVAIELLLIAGKSSSVLIAAEDAAIDLVMSHWRNRAWQSDSPGFVLLEADQEAFASWEEPFYFPRQRVQDMIAFASGFEFDRGVARDLDDRSASPALIIVDIDLAKEGTADGSTELREYLARYSTQPNPPLVLVKTFSNWPQDGIDTLPRERQSFLDSVVSSASNRNLVWASPHFQFDDDFHVRRWRLWLKTRKPDGYASVLPSVQLLSQVLLDRSDARPPLQKYNDLRDMMRLAAEAGCGILDSADYGATGRIRMSYGSGRDERAINLCDTPLSQRLIYTIPYELPAGERRPLIALDDRRVPILERESAVSLIAADRRFLDERIVVVGGSYRETRDWYATPIGEMPGAMIILNAIHSLAANGPLEPPPPAWRLMILVGLVLSMTLLFSILSGFIAYLVASAAILVVLVPASFLAFRSGVWVDFALPLVAVQVHEFLAEFETITRRRRSRDPAARVGVRPAVSETASRQNRVGRPSN